MHFPFSISLGPISILTGIPFNSHSLNLNPGLTWSLESTSTLNSSFSSFLSSSAFSNTPSLCIAIGIIFTCIGATFGGSFSPLWSPCAIINAPISLVLIPHEV